MIFYIANALGMVAFGIYMIKRGPQKAINERSGRLLRIMGYGDSFWPASDSA